MLSRANSIGDTVPNACRKFITSLGLDFCLGKLKNLHQIGILRPEPDNALWWVCPVQYSTISSNPGPRPTSTQQQPHIITGASSVLMLQF